MWAAVRSSAWSFLEHLSMGRVSDTVGTVNTTLRTLLMLVLVGGAGYGGY
jgi:hypothetical protein